MKKTLLATSAFALALGMATASLPAFARADDLSFPIIFKMADRNGDGIVTREEFVAAMGKAYDMRMDAMKGDTKMVKGSAMTRDGLRDLLNSVHSGA